MARKTDQGLVSGYEIAKTVNEMLKARDGAEAKEIQPQMVYQYIRSGRIDSIEVDDTKGGKTKMVDPKVAATWIKSYLAGESAGGRRSTEENVAKLRALVDGAK